MTNERVESDVLVIGGGLAGCWAAIRAKAFAQRVILVDKAFVARSGTSASAYFVLAPPDDPDLWKRELVEKGNFLNDQDWVDVLLKEHGDRVSEMTAWGVPFERDEQGGLIRRAGRGHRSTRFVSSDGRLRMEALKRRARQVGVEIIERVMCTDLLTSDGLHPTSGSVVGAVGFHTRTGDAFIFHSKTVVVTTGPMWPGTNLSGDGTAMAFRAGTELASMEFCINPVCYMSDGKRNLGTFNVLLQSLGPKILNSHGERFMPKYSPVLEERSDWALLSQAIAKETLAGRGPAVLDMSHVTDEEWGFFAKVNPGRIAPFAEAGLDLRKDRILLVPKGGVNSVHGDGGIKIDTWGRTNVPGLYGAGSACKNGVHGTFTVGGINLAFCCSSGYRAGERAAEDSQHRAIVRINETQVKALKASALSKLGHDKGHSVKALATRVDKLVSPAAVSIIKREDRLRSALARLDSAEREVVRTTATDTHELVKRNQLHNYITLSCLSFLSALERKESRHCHYREDYPFRDDLDWLKWVIVRDKGEDGVELRVQPVPMEAYSVKPSARERIPHAVQLP